MKALPSLSLAVVGMKFENKDKSNRRFELALCAPGEPVELRLEPKNPFDPRAVAIYSSRGIQIGYLTAERCGRIGALIREGREVAAVFQRLDTSAAWIRVAFDGQVPTLPAERSVEVADLEFYADEVWPDE